MKHWIQQLHGGRLLIVELLIGLGVFLFWFVLVVFIPVPQTDRAHLIACLVLIAVTIAALLFAIAVLWVWLSGRTSALTLHQEGKVSSPGQSGGSVGNSNS